MLKKFYHVSYGHNELIKKFVPRIPDVYSDKESTTIPRICLADTIDHCLSAMSDKPYTTYDNKPITIYSIDLEERELVHPDYLYSHDWVRDALYTREHWLLKPATLLGYHAYLRSFNSGTYFIPDESKHDEMVNLIMAKYAEADLKKLKLSVMHDVLTNLLPDNWDTYRIDETDISEELGLDSMRTMYDAEIIVKET